MFIRGSCKLTTKHATSSPNIRKVDGLRPGIGLGARAPENLQPPKHKFGGRSLAFDLTDFTSILLASLAPRATCHLAIANSLEYFNYKFDTE
jgi:hypothetical protein